MSVLVYASEFNYTLDSMAASTITLHSGTHDFQIAELRNAKVHIYDTVAHANGDVGNAVGRFCYILETSLFYAGQTGVWTVIAGIATIDLIGHVADVGSLPSAQPDGTTYVVDADASFGGTPNIYVSEGGTWNSIRGDTPTTVISKTFASHAIFASSQRVLVKLDPTGGSFTQLVPTTATEGDQIQFKDVSGVIATNPVFLDPGSNTIDGIGTGSPLELSRNYQCVTLMYTGSHWFVISDA